LIYGGVNGVGMSADDGKTWTINTATSGHFETMISAGDYVYALLDNGSNSIYYAGYSLYKSGDNGITWEKLIDNAVQLELAKEEEQKRTAEAERLKFVTDSVEKVAQLVKLKAEKEEEQKKIAEAERMKFVNDSIEKQAQITKLMAEKEAENKRKLQELQKL
jgi:SPX domain protein involved in polyphosphate accumulation